MITNKQVWVSPTLAPNYQGIGPAYLCLTKDVGEEIKLPEVMWCTHGWENNCFHAKCISAETTPTNLSEEEARINAKLIQGGYEIYEDLGRGAWQKTTVSGSLSEHVHVTILHGDRYGVREEWHSYWWDGDHVMESYLYPYSEPSVRDLGDWHGWRSGRRGEFKIGITPMDPKTWAYFNEYTMENNPPKAEPDPYVGHGYPPKSQNTSFTQDVLLQELMQKAYYEAAMDVRPKLNDNNFQNAEAVIAGIAIVVSLCRKYPPTSGRGAKAAKKKAAKVINKIAKSPASKTVKSAAKATGSAWLFYRYAYGTTKMDIEEAKAYVDDHLEVYDRDDCHYGTSTGSFSGSTVRCTCRVRGKERDGLSRLKGITEKLWEYGFSPNFYTLWDSLPFSFMVDWALPVGDFYNHDAAKRFLTEEYLEIDGVCFSIKYQRELPNKTVYEYYSRWVNEPLRIDTEFWTVNDKVSTHTVQKRVNDVIAISTNFL